jgi:branched-chain amino acid transport system permease protein
VLLPILLDHLVGTVLTGIVDPSNTENLQKLVFGSLILFFLVKEPDGLARLAQLQWAKLSSRLRSSPSHPDLAR